MSIKIIDGYLDTTELISNFDQLKLSPKWEVHDIEWDYGNGSVTYSLFGRSVNFYYTDRHCGGPIYNCKLHVNSDKTMKLTDWTKEIIE